MTCAGALRLLAAAAVAAGCAASEGGATSTSEPAPARLALGLRDHGRSVQVARTTRITLVLPERWRWSHPVSRGAAVTVNEIVSDAPNGGQRWRLRARERGRAIVTTRGSPACRPTTPGCPAPRRYVVTLVVG
jgi:hypothetical protein